MAQGDLDPNFKPVKRSLGREFNHFSWRNVRREHPEASLAGPFQTLEHLATTASSISMGNFENSWLIAPLTNRARDPLFILNVLGPEPFSDGRDGFWTLTLRIDLRWKDFDLDPNFVYLNELLAGVGAVENSFLWPGVEKIFAKNLGSFTKMIGGCYPEGMSALYNGIAFEYSISKLAYDELLRLTLDGLAFGHKIGVSTISLEYGVEPAVVPDLEEGIDLDLRAVLWGHVAGRVCVYFVMRSPRRLPLQGSIYPGCPIWAQVENPLKVSLTNKLAEIGTLAIALPDFQARCDQLHVIKPLPPILDMWLGDGPHEFYFENRRGVCWSKTIQMRHHQPYEGLIIAAPENFNFPAQLYGIANQQGRRRQGLRYLEMGLSLYYALVHPVPRRVRFLQTLASAEKMRRSERGVEYVCRDRTPLELRPSLKENAGGEIQLFAFLLEGVVERVDSPQLLELLEAVRLQEEA